MNRQIPAIGLLAALSLASAAASAQPTPPPVVANPEPVGPPMQEHLLGSRVLPSSETPPPEDALTLTGGQAVNEADCAGRDAVINADNARFVLRGRCRSISVTGSHDVVEAEMLAGSRIRINGDHSTVQFALIGTGADPIVSSVGQGNAAWRIQRLGATSRETASQGVTPSSEGMVVRGGKGADAAQMRAVPEAPQ